MNNQTVDFIFTYLHTDLKTLQLQKLPPDVDRMQALQQIASRQKACAKLLPWAVDRRVVMPGPAVLEQASSWPTALYKARVMREFTPKDNLSLADITAGAGADMAAFAMAGFHVTALEHDAEPFAALETIVAHYGEKRIHLKCGDSLAHLPFMGDCATLYADPQRRDSEGKRTNLRLSDWQPDLKEVIRLAPPSIKDFLFKIAPVYDIARAATIFPHVENIRIVEWRGAVRDLLIHVRRQEADAHHDPVVTAVMIDDNGIPLFEHERPMTTQPPIDYDTVKDYLYEPSPAWQKANMTAHLAHRYDLQGIAPDTHLLTAKKRLSDFPGRVFQVVAIVKPDSRDVAEYITDGQANLSIRNYPETVFDLKKKLRLRDGGDVYLFACTLHDGLKRILVTRKVQMNAL